MTACRADSWTPDVYLSFFNSSLNQHTELREELFNILDNLDEWGYYVFCPTTTLDMDTLRKEYANFVDIRNAQKLVQCVNAPSKADKKTPNCNLINFQNMHNKKIAILGLVGRHTPTVPGKPTKTVFRDPTALFPNLTEKVFSCELPNNAEYFSMNKFVRKNARNCPDCSSLLNAQGIMDITDEYRCDHVYEICNLDGSRENMKNDEDLAAYLEANSASGEHFAILVGTMFGITNWTGYYKFSLAADKLYVFSSDLREKITQERRLEKRNKRKEEFEIFASKRLHEGDDIEEEEFEKFANKRLFEGEDIEEEK
jgi:hypothetical protein